MPEELFAPSVSAPGAPPPVLLASASAPAPTFVQSDDDLSAETLGFIDATERTPEEEDDVLLLPDATQLWPEQRRPVEVDAGEGSFDIEIDVDADLAPEPPPAARPVWQPPAPPQPVAELRPPPARQIDHREQHLHAQLPRKGPILEEPVGQHPPVGLELEFEVHPPALGIARLFDQQDLVGARHLLLVAPHRPFDVSIEGNRVAWAENGGGRHRVRAATAPD